MQTKRFRSWPGCRGGGEGEKAVFYCYGASGVGKTCIRYKALPCIHGTEQGWSLIHFDSHLGAHKKYVFQRDMAVVKSDQIAKPLKSGLLNTLAR